MNRIAGFVIAVLAMLIGRAYAIDHPQMKEGLWQVRTLMISNPGNKKTDGTVSLCRSHAFDKATEALATAKKSCAVISESFAGGKYSAETRCEIGSTVMVVKAVTTSSGDASIHSETHVSYAPALYGISDETILQDQIYLGGCPPRMQPGDRKSQDGSIVHRRVH